jgi:SAM-dependent methyltransferase
MQNVVYDLPAAAKQCASGTLTLVTCQECGHTFNGSFDPSLVVYDESYNNNVPSEVMDRYYGALAEYLYQKYNLKRSPLVDVGCGKGIFLKKLAEKYPDVPALGIDPSYEPANDFDSGNKLTFIRDIFRAQHLHSKPSLVVCRHVLEHISDLPRFLADIRAALSSSLPVPFFIEVPDLTWIINHRAFWDFCYEHCNYFTAESLQECLRLSGYEVDKATAAFGGQYLWIEGQISPHQPRKSSEPTTAIPATTKRLQDYGSQEQKQINRDRAFLQQKREEKRHTVIWGMATKGVLFTHLIDPDSILVNQCVDVNPDKQGKFLPITGRIIQAPSTISALSVNPVVIVMNPNYKEEILALCGTLGLESDLYDVDQL